MDKQILSGITVLDQSYNHSSAAVPPGYYEASTPEVDPINLECYFHSEEDIPKEEEEEETEDGGISLGDLINQWLTP